MSGFEFDLNNIPLDKKTREFKIPLGAIIKDEKRNFVITDREYRKDIQNCNRKWYKYTCNKCGWNDGWMIEWILLKGQGCSACCVNNKTPVLGINTIWDTDRWMVELGVDENWAKNNLPQSNRKAPCKCPYCKEVKTKTTSDIYYGKTIGCVCGDGVSYPEKLISNILKQLNIDYVYQYSPNYLKQEGFGRKASDFYLPSYKLIIETDGELGHIGGIVHSKNKKKLEELIEIDKWKDEQHLKNGIKTIRINCFESDVEYIKNNILSSELANIFDLSKIEWSMADLYAWKTNLKWEVCQYWNAKESNENTKDLANMFKLSKSTIVNYLNKGTDLGWCYYCGKEEKFKGSSKVGLSKGKKVEMFKDGVSLGIFNSCAELSRKSKDLFGVKLGDSAISSVARGRCKKYKGYYFSYVGGEHDV